VVAQQREISRLRYVVARQQQIIRYQAGVIRYQAGVISYYKGVVNVLGFRLWGGTPQYSWVMNSIHSFRGIPAGAFNYDRISILQATVAARDATISRLMAGGGGLGGGGGGRPGIMFANGQVPGGSGASGGGGGSGSQLPDNWRQLMDDIGDRSSPAGSLADTWITDLPANGSTFDSSLDSSLDLSLEESIAGSISQPGRLGKVCLGILFWICGRIELPRPPDAGPGPTVPPIERPVDGD